MRRNLLGMVCSLGLLWLAVGNLLASEAFSNRELLRNGDFTLGDVAWYASNGWKEMVEINGQSSTGFRLESFGDPYYAFMVSELRLPKQLDSARLSFNYRLSANSGAQLGFFIVRIVTEDVLNAQTFDESYLLKALDVRPENFPGYDWYAGQVSLSASELDSINQAHAQGHRLYVLIELYAQFMAARVDNVSFIADGQEDHPQMDGAIAFIETDDAGNAVAVSRIDPDGENRQQLWQSSSVAPSATSIYDVAWKPDGTELAFSSNHESGFSAFQTDVYAMRPDGAKLRRVSNPPSLAYLKSLNNPAVGTVTGSVRNTYGSTTVAPFLIYVQGALDAKSLTLGQKDEAVSFSIPNVVDLGAGDLPYVVFAWSNVNSANCREFKPAAIADVRPGETVDIGELSFDGYCGHYDASTITWRADGSELIADVVGPHRFKSSGEAIGRSVFNNTAFAHDPAWSPVDAGKLLYHHWSATASENGLYLSSLDGEPGALLVNVNDVSVSSDWLPDGSGFVYADNKRLIQFDMTTKQASVLAEFYNEFVSNPSVSPDGKFIVFGRSYTIDSQNHSELWLLNRTQPNQMWPLIKDGKAINPDWGKPIKILPAGACYKEPYTLPAIPPPEDHLYSEEKISNGESFSVKAYDSVTLLAPTIIFTPLMQVAKGAYFLATAESINCAAQMP